MESSPTYTTREFRPIEPSRDDVYRIAYGSQLAALTRALAKWSAVRYRRQLPATYQPQPSGLSSTRLTVIEGSALEGLKSLASDRFATKSIHDNLDSHYSELDKLGQPRSMIARSVEHITNDEGGTELWLTFNQPTPAKSSGQRALVRTSFTPLHEDRQHIRSILEDATRSRIQLREDYDPGILLMRFGSTTIMRPLEMEALTYRIQKEALPMPTKLGRIVLPNWMQEIS